MIETAIVNAAWLSESNLVRSVTSVPSAHSSKSCGKTGPVDSVLIATVSAATGHDTNVRAVLSVTGGAAAVLWVSLACLAVNELVTLAPELSSTTGDF